VSKEIKFCWNVIPLSRTDYRLVELIGYRISEGSAYFIFNADLALNNFLFHGFCGEAFHCRPTD